MSSVFFSLRGCFVLNCGADTSLFEINAAMEMRSVHQRVQYRN